MNAESERQHLGLNLVVVLQMMTIKGSNITKPKIIDFQQIQTFPIT